MTCKTETCSSKATHGIDNRGRVIVRTHAANDYCLVHAAGRAAYDIIRPKLNMAFTFVAVPWHERSVGGHKSQRGF